MSYGDDWQARFTVALPQFVPQYCPDSAYEPAVVSTRVASISGRHGCPRARCGRSSCWAGVNLNRPRVLSSPTIRPCGQSPVRGRCGHSPWFRVTDARIRAATVGCMSLAWVSWGRSRTSMRRVPGAPDTTRLYHRRRCMASATSFSSATTIIGSSIRSVRKIFRPELDA